LKIEVKKDLQNKKLYINQRKFGENMLELFRIYKCKQTCTLSQVGLILPNNMSSKGKEKEDEMEKVSYVSTIGSLMYSMVCTRPIIKHEMGVVSRYMENPKRDHWTMSKGFLGTYEAPVTVIFYEEDGSKKF
jgi:ATP-binding cassette subfamily B (MDR/TAP) protein 1